MFGWKIVSVEAFAALRQASRHRWAGGRKPSVCSSWFQKCASFTYPLRSAHMFCEMPDAMVDDVQFHCYYLKVPRVKSGLPVGGDLTRHVSSNGDRFRQNLG